MKGRQGVPEDAPPPLHDTAALGNRCAVERRRPGEHPDDEVLGALNPRRTIKRLGGGYQRRCARILRAHWELLPRGNPGGGEYVGGGGVDSTLRAGVFIMDPMGGGDTRRLYTPSLSLQWGVGAREFFFFKGLFSLHRWDLSCCLLSPLSDLVAPPPACQKNLPKK